MEKRKKKQFLKKIAKNRFIEKFGNVTFKFQFWYDLHNS